MNLEYNDNSRQYVFSYQKCFFHKSYWFYDIRFQCLLRVFLIKQVLILNKQCLLEIFPYKMKYANLSVCLLFNRLFKLVVVALTQTIQKIEKVHWYVECRVKIIGLYSSGKCTQGH